MIDIVFAVTPVFILIAMGYIAARTGYLPKALGDSLGAFAAKLAVPMLLSTAMMRLDLASAFSLPVLISFYTGALTCFIVGITLARTLFGRRPGEAVAFGFAATFSNSVLLGVPIVERAFGTDTLEIAFGIIALHAPSLYTIGMITMEMMRRDGKTIGETLTKAGRSIIVNPLMVGIVFGLAVNLSGMPLPEPVMAPLSMLAMAAIPAALVGMGATLTQYKLTADPVETLTAASLSIILHPLIAFVMAYWVFDLPREAVLAVVGIAAMPPGVNIYIFASLYQRAVGLAASALLIATVLSVLTISGWLYALKLAGLS